MAFRNSTARRRIMSEIEQAVNACIEDIWASYDTDKNGFLDRDETKQFVEAVLAKMQEDGVDVDPMDFDECFDGYDKNGDGKLSKKEMRVFVEQLMGLAP
ncbi:Aste57867_23110 [Aphanomyces stellatus]|uniref:Aste57867_23110 protein n=1 Tax=Aphanomyces stellatus TaxID=120398 RepID=A0A485LMB2_9STRA|nr:hypothetical protein As57867_023039 [Aphanomyces stellatus]VFT99758.1 Aste57867_23110 [Aphanomyces stellatus]